MFRLPHLSRMFFSWQTMMITEVNQYIRSHTIQIDAALKENLINVFSLGKCILPFVICLVTVCYFSLYAKINSNCLNTKIIAETVLTVFHMHSYVSHDISEIHVSNVVPAGSPQRVCEVPAKAHSINSFNCNIYYMFLY